jgi:hypothetical protein
METHLNLRPRQSGAAFFFDEACFQRLLGNPAHPREPTPLVLALGRLLDAASDTRSLGPFPFGHAMTNTRKCWVTFVVAYRDGVKQYIESTA